MDMLIVVLRGITCVLGIPGNGFVIWIAGVKMKKTVNTIWYVNLAVADLLCCLAIPFLLAGRVFEYWPYGGAMCKILPTVINLSMFASVFTLTLISLDRFSMIIRPVWAQNHRNVFRAWLLCGLAWFLAQLLSLPDVIYSHILEVNNKTLCILLYVDEATRSFSRFICVSRSMLGFFVPLLIITVCSLFIARRVSAGRFKSQKALRIMAGVVTAFVVCWMPYHIVGLVMVFGKGSAVKVAWAVSSLALSLAFINSCLNPVLYMFMGRDFKDRFKVSLRRMFENAFREDSTRPVAEPDHFYTGGKAESSMT